SVGMAVGGLSRVELDGVQVLGALVAVLTRAHQTHRTAMVAAERHPIEVVCDDDVIIEGILESEHGPEAVDAGEEHMAHPGPGDRLDHGLIERAQLHSSPSQTLHAPTGDAVEV